MASVIVLMDERGENIECILPEEATFELLEFDDSLKLPEATFRNRQIREARISELYMKLQHDTQDFHAYDYSKLNQLRLHHLRQKGFRHYEVVPFNGK